MVVAGSFTVHVLVNGIAFTYGVMVPSLVDHWDCGRAVIGGVASLMIGLQWISGACVRAFIQYSQPHVQRRYVCTVRTAALGDERW